MIALCPASRAPAGATHPADRKLSLWIGSCSLRSSPTRLHGRRNVPGEVDLWSAFEVRIEVWRVEVVLSGDADQGEEGVAPGIGERRSHSARRSGFANRADRPLG